MVFSDFLDQDLAALASDLSLEIDKVYQRTNLAGKNAAVDRLRRQANALAEKIAKAQDSRQAGQTSRLLEDALRLTHECVPFLDLCLRKILLSKDLHARWTHRLSGLALRLEEWKTAAEKPRMKP